MQRSFRLPVNLNNTYSITGNTFKTALISNVNEEPDMTYTVGLSCPGKLYIQSSQQALSKQNNQRGIFTFLMTLGTRFSAIPFRNTHNSFSQVFCRPCQALPSPYGSNITFVNVHKGMFADFDMLNLFIQLLTTYLVTLILLSSWQLCYSEISQPDCTENCSQTALIPIIQISTWHSIPDCFKCQFSVLFRVS